MKYSDTFYRKIDSICDIAITNIYTASKKDKKIVLSNIDVNNEDHMFLVNIGIIARDIFDWPIYFCGNIWNWFKLYRKTKKENRTYLRFLFPLEKKKTKNIIDSEEFLKFMTPLLKTVEEENITYGDIYKIYYSSEREL